MEKETLETITQRLDRLEKTVAEMNQKLSAAVAEVVTDTPKNCETTTVNVTDIQKDEQDDNIGAKAIEKILARMGYPPDFIVKPVIIFTVAGFQTPPAVGYMEILSIKV